jgi:hypothetical protein
MMEVTDGLGGFGSQPSKRPNLPNTGVNPPRRPNTPEVESTETDTIRVEVSKVTDHSDSQHML